VKKIVQLLLETLSQRLKEQEVGFEFSDAAVEFITENGYSAEFGARPIKRFIQRNVETLLAKTLISNDKIEGAAYRLDVENNALTVKLL
jgi:ATP-dependent Clp protease ATP-binding subunit ClpB